MSNPEPIEDLVESELTGDNGELYLFQWLSSTEKRLANIPLDILKGTQSDVEASLLKVIIAPTPFPVPGRALRHLASRCLISIYTRGETRTLFDTLQSLLKVVGDFKAQDKDVYKVAAFSCIGDLMAAFGSQVMSFIAEITLVSLKTLRSSTFPLLRFHALVTLRKTLVTAKRAVTDASSRDILKQARNALTDKSLPIQRAAAEVLIAMYSSEGPFPTASEIETIISLCVRSLEGADQLTRHSLSMLVGHLLAFTQTERAIPNPELAQKSKKDPNTAEDDDATSAAAEITKAMLTPPEMLAYLSVPFNKPNTSRKMRIGMFDFYAALLTKLGATFVENHFIVIVSHLMTEIVSNPRNVATRYERLLVRSLVGILLRDLIGVRMLSEQAQISAIQELAKVYLRRWPAMLPGQTAPDSAVLVIVLREVAGLLQQLGNAPPPVQDALADPLLTLLAHPSHTTRIAAAWALRCFCYSTPLRLPKTILTTIELLQRDLSLLTTPSSSGSPSPPVSRALGHAHALGALVALIPERPLYVSYDVSAKVFDMAVQVLKRASEHDLRVAAVEVEIAWTLIAALMSLGPGFVRPHLQQLLVLWRNALPKPTSRDVGGGGAVGSGASGTATPSGSGGPSSIVGGGLAGKSTQEWKFLLNVRESALGAILCFLRHNSGTLVTLDVARRVASVLANALSFANGFSSSVLSIADAGDAFAGGVNAPLGDGLSGKGLTLRACESLLRRRVYQCFSALGFASIPDTTQSVLLQSAVSLFASPDGYAGSSVQAAIASSAGTFVSVWSSVDGYAYGVTFSGVKSIGAGKVGSAENESGDGPSGGQDIEGEDDYLNRDTVEVQIDDLLRKPVLGACEHDPLVLCQARSANKEYRLVEPPPPGTAVVDNAIELFAQLLPLQDLVSTTKTINQLLESVKSPKLERNTGRKAAVQINAAVAITLALRQATAAHFKQARETFGSSQITTLLGPFLKDALVDGDLLLRSASSEAMGRLASLSDTNFLTTQIKHLVDQVVNNRDPQARAGCALAFGAIYTHVGGLAAGPLLKTTVNVLMSLSNDPHPVVHFWALSALARVINAASLAYSPFVSSTLGMLLKVSLLESHEREGGTLNNANISGDCPAYPVVCQIIDAVTNVLGPDMQESPRTRSLVLSLIREFSLEDDEGICVEAIKCMQHFLMFAPEHVDIPAVVEQFRGHLNSPRRPLKLASINALYQLVQKDALAMSKLGGDRLVEDLFGMLDDDWSVQGVRNVIRSWMQQTVIHNPSAWIDLCQRIMARTTASQQVADAAQVSAIGGHDDEGQSLNFASAQSNDGGGAGGGGGGRGHLTSRWRTQLFALECLHMICGIVATSGRKEHLDPVFAKARGVPAKGLLVSRVPDLIKMAFTASTAYVTEIRLEGLVVLRDVIEIFAMAPDPEYGDALLLEQHQAPITAALTPAFSSDSTPEILSSAVHACAVFVGCGVVKDLGRMGRILKLLTTALDQSKENGMLSLGETGELSPNASAMLRISTLSAWAQLEVASAEQKYLVQVLKPYRSTLASLWIAALRDYASVRVDSEVLHDTSSVALDSSYSSLGKEVLLPYYVESWPVILQAVAVSMRSGDPSILAAMDGQEYSQETKVAAGKKREEPTMFFFIIFGLVYEALATTSSDSSSAGSARRNLAHAALEALKSLVRPEYAGAAILESTIFDEFISLCYRIAMTETADVQVDLMEMLTTLAATQLPKTGVDSGDRLSLTSPRAHCLRICAYVLRHSASTARGPIIQGEVNHRVKMISTAFASFCSIALSLETTQREDVRGVGILLYTELLKDESSELDLVGPTLPALKSLLDLPLPSASDAVDRYSRMVHGLISACLLNVDEMRGRHGQISTRKIKNNLLAAVLILTIIPQTIKVGRAVLEHCCFLINQKLLETDEVTLTAAHCAKTLIVASTSGHLLLRQCTKILLPGLIEYTAKMAPFVHDGSLSETQTAAIGEVWKALSTFFSSLPEDHRTRMLGVLLPTISLILPVQASTTSAFSTQMIAQLLSFATSSPAAFKEAAGKLDSTTRELLEQSIRRAVGASAGSATAHATAKPAISLRSF